jgi:hypothetical protein
LDTGPARSRASEFSGFIVSLAEQTLVQSVFFKRLVCPPDHPAAAGGNDHRGFPPRYSC